MPEGKRIYNFSERKVSNIVFALNEKVKVTNHSMKKKVKVSNLQKKKYIGSIMFKFW